MRSPGSALLILLAGIATSAQAIVVTPALSSCASGTTVSTAFAGLTLTQLRQPSGSAFYAPLPDVAVIFTCSSYGACPHFGPVNALGDSVHSMNAYRLCYKRNGCRPSQRQLCHAVFRHGSPLRRAHRLHRIRAHLAQRSATADRV